LNNTPVNTLSRRGQADVMYIGNASSSSSWRLADVPQMSVTDPAVELTICATDRQRAIRRHLGKPRAARWREGVICFQRHGQTRQHLPGKHRLTIARRACTASRQILNDWRNWTPSDQQLQHLAACIDWLCWPIVVNMSFSGMFESRLYQYRDRRTQDNKCYIYTRRTDDTIIQHKVIRDV